MSSSFDVIGLVSGGKDSFFSVLHCLAHGHNVVALANLYPPPSSNSSDNDEDINSYMYQTVGHTLVPLYDKALCLPVYRQQIFGTAVNTDKEYHVKPNPSGFSPSLIEEDETESLTILLRRVLQNFPSARAVCSGAILSSYQRTRIESVARRLHLISLAFLWQYPSLPTPEPRPAGLLEDMAAVGLDARIIKVASGGLDEDLLWQNVCAKSTKEKIEKAVKRFGGSVLGEGGEFETIVIDGPSELVQGTIKVTDAMRKVVSDGSGVFSMSFTGATVETKEKNRPAEAPWRERLNIPLLFDSIFKDILGEFDAEILVPQRNLPRRLSIHVPEPQHRWYDSCYVHEGPWTLRISNLTASYAAETAETQMEAIKIALIEKLKQYHRLTSDIVFTTIVLRTMQDYPAVNLVYRELFLEKPNPPARVTIACGDCLPPKVHAMVSVVVDRQARELRQGLHVQSTSYWAPANIGPYSQAIAVPMKADEETSFVYIAGQIPLVPATMALLPSSTYPKMHAFARSTILSLQHLCRIGTSMGRVWWTGATAYIAADDEDISAKAQIAFCAWEKLHQKLPIIVTESGDGSTSTSRGAEEEETEGFVADEDGFGDEQGVSDPTTFSTKRDFNDDSSMPPFLAVEVTGLPRDAEIEWHALGVSPFKLVRRITFTDAGCPGKACSCFPTAAGSRVVAFMSIPLGAHDLDLLGTIDSWLQAAAERWGERDTARHITIYTTRKLLPLGVQNAQWVPCRSVWGPKGEELAAAGVYYHENGAEGNAVFPE